MVTAHSHNFQNCVSAHRTLPGHMSQERMLKKPKISVSFPQDTAAQGHANPRPPHRLFWGSRCLPTQSAQPCEWCAQHVTYLVITTQEDRKQERFKHAIYISCRAVCLSPSCPRLVTHPNQQNCMYTCRTVPTQGASLRQQN